MFLIIFAMLEEIEAFTKLVGDVTKIDDKYYEIYKTVYLNKTIILAKCGPGKINASSITSYLLGKYDFDLVINTGCAGSLSKDIKVFDTVVSSKVAVWDMIIPEGEKWNRSFDNPLLCVETSSIVTEIVKKLNNQDTYIGPIVTGDSFIFNKNQVNDILQHFNGALCGEMEGFAIAFVCAKHQIDCTIIRSISDCTLVQDDFLNFDFNLSKACNRAAKLTLQIIERYKHE